MVDFVFGNRVRKRRKGFSESGQGEHFLSGEGGIFRRLSLLIQAYALNFLLLPETTICPYVVVLSEFFASIQ